MRMRNSSNRRGEPTKREREREKLHTLSTESSYGVMSAFRDMPRRPSKQLVPVLLYNAQLVKVAHITQQVGIHHQIHSRRQPLFIQLCRRFLSQTCDCIPTRCMSMFTATETPQLKSATCAHLPTDSLPAGAIATTLLQVLWLQSLQGLHRRWPLRCLCCRSS